MPRDEIESLLALLDLAYDRRSWHGPNLRGSIRGLPAREAAWRPAPGRHSVWELVVHSAYWKYAARRRITGEKRGSFPIAGSNWFPRPGKIPKSSAERAWKADIALLEVMHRSLRAAIARLAPRDLRRTLPGSALAVAELIRGVALHDVYHSGQIQLIKRLQRLKHRRLRPPGR
jgi:hypothetical protein